MSLTRSVVGLAVVLALSVLHPSAVAQAPPPFTGVSGLFFALSVADLDASAKWYADKFGMKVIMPSSRHDKVSVTVLDGHGLTVELMQHQAAKGAAEIPLTHGIVKVGIVVDDLDKTAAALKSRGVPIFMGPFPAQGEMKRNMLIKDNAGNLIQFFGR